MLHKPKMCAYILIRALILDGNHFLLQNLDPNNLTDEGHKATLLWSFELVPAPAAQFVRPSVAKESPLDEYFPPVKIDAESQCNCASPSLYCLVAMIANSAENVVSIASEEETESPVSSEEECSAGEEVDDGDANSDKEYFTETFAVKGSFWEGRYQESLIKCVEHKAKEENVEVRTCFETDNLRDRNAIKFEVLYFAAWHVIGYCGVEKIPKLTKAIRRREIISCKLKYVKRKWIPPISAFRYYAAVAITKEGRWDRNDPNNKYDSALIL